MHTIAIDDPVAWASVGRICLSRGRLFLLIRQMAPADAKTRSIAACERVSQHLNKSHGPTVILRLRQSRRTIDLNDFNILSCIA